MNAVITKEEAMRRFVSAKKKKQACVERMKAELAVAYEQRTGKKAKQMFVL